MTQDKHGTAFPLAQAWRALHEEISARFRRLNAEIREYPTPIARCDEQLTRLIEQRDQVRSLLGSIAELDDANDRSHARMRSFLAEALRDEEIAAAMPSPLKTIVVGGSQP